MEEYNFNNFMNFSEMSDLNFGYSIEDRNEKFNANIESIINDYNYNHYFCTSCSKFPFIKFCKDRKNVRLTCSCFNNKKVSIKELFKMLYIKNSRAIFLPESILNINIENENELRCKKHKKKFKGFSKFYLNNYCEDFNKYKYELYDNDIIEFNKIRIEDNKIKEIIEKINDNKDISEEMPEEGLIILGLLK